MFDVRIFVLFGVILRGASAGDQSTSNETAPVDATSVLGTALGQIFDAGLDVYTPISSTLGNSLCRTHGLLFRQGIRQGQLWALHMLDASSKLPSGLLTGNLVQLGNFDQCLAVSHTDPEHGPIRGQHCLVSLGIRNSLSELVHYDKMTSGSFSSTGLEEVESFLAQGKFDDALAHVGATWSLCVPASCSPGDLQRHLRAVLPGRIQVRVDDLACGTWEELGGRPWSLGARLVGLLLGCIALLVAAGTTYDLLNDNDTQPRNQYLVALSLYTNGRSLLKITTDSDTLASFDGLRCITILWTILIHHSLFHVLAPTVNFRNLEAISRDWMHLIVANGSVAVDSMFVMSGALVANNFFRERERNIEFRLWRYYLDRYFRLTPTYVVALLLSATVISDMGDTPFARLNGAQLSASCAKYGWLGPLYLTNYLDGDHSCVCQIWSTSVDMHLYWLSPLLLFPLFRKPRLGLTLLLALAAGGTLQVYNEAYRIQLPPVNFLLTSPVSDYMNSLYYKTHLRATPWLIGVVLGYLLHKTKDQRNAITGIQSVLGWSTSVLLAAYAFLSAHASFQRDASFERVATALHLTAMRPAWALGVAWTLFACQRGRGGFVNAFLSWPGWQVPSRLCFAVTFTSFVVAIGLPSLKKTPQHYSDLLAMVEFFGVVVASVVVGVVLHLAVEVPSLRLYRLCMGKRTSASMKLKQS